MLSSAGEWTSDGCQCRRLTYTKQSSSGSHGAMSTGQASRKCIGLQSPLMSLGYQMDIRQVRGYQMDSKWVSAKIEKNQPRVSPPTVATDVPKVRARSSCIELQHVSVLRWRPQKSANQYTCKRHKGNKHTYISGVGDTAAPHGSLTKQI